MAKRKTTKKPHPALLSMEQAQREVATELAARVKDAATAAFQTLVHVAERGDLNGTRITAARSILEIAGAMGQRSSLTAKATVEDKDGQKMIVEVVHIEKPPATDDE
jgi:hypothetical protein